MVEAISNTRSEYGGNLIAEKLSALEDAHLLRTAQIIRAGGIIAFPFNGVFGLFGDWDNPAAAEAIIEAKNRPKDRKLIAVHIPERVDLYADLACIPYLKENIVALWRSIHALGIILPASAQSPEGLRIVEDDQETLLTIWTEYSPLRTMMGYFQELGGRGLVGTSANKSGEPTHFDPDSLWADFYQNVQAIVVDRFDHLPKNRKKSTSIIDLTNNHPRLHREGNVSKDEIREALKRHKFPELVVGRDVITVKGR